MRLKLPARVREFVLDAGDACEFEVGKRLHAGRFALELPFLVEDTRGFGEEGEDEANAFAWLDDILIVVAEEPLLCGVLDGVRLLANALDALPLIVDGGTAIIPDYYIIVTDVARANQEGDVLLFHFELRWA